MRNCDSCGADTDGEIYCGGCASEWIADRDRLAIAVNNVSGALCDASTIPVPSDPVQYGEAVRELTAERERLRERNRQLSGDLESVARQNERLRGYLSRRDEP